jgi:hypothetical protein
MFALKIHVPNNIETRQLVLKEVYDIPSTCHPRYQKTITTLRKQSSKKEERYHRLCCYEFGKSKGEDET